MYSGRRLYELSVQFFDLILGMFRGVWGVFLGFPGRLGVLGRHLGGMDRFFLIFGSVLGATMRSKKVLLC